MNHPHFPPARLVVSVVSHGHGELVQRLLEQIAGAGEPVVSRVVLTQNIPEPHPRAPSGGWPFELEVAVNATPVGFGANHNQALANVSESHVCVINPDVELIPGQPPFDALVQSCQGPGSGCAYPAQTAPDGSVQDSEREIPSPAALFRRRFLGAREQRVDWVNAACIVLPVEVWRAVGGFDERYFMYCEDVDICLRVRLQGLRLVRAPVKVVHAGQRASHRRLQHLLWHVRSLWRLWRSPVYRQAQQLLTAPSGGAGTIGPQ
ncbi:glycosyl transferase [Acidovorax sp. BL-A-41-H1]|uniref:glycosyl transferase n=1 Tax=Acidovorax sp. BL-A-41-H1 TaxID=3421102 RepID=UPI003F7917D9